MIRERDFVIPLPFHARHDGAARIGRQKLTCALTMSYCGWTPATNDRVGDGFRHLLSVVFVVVDGRVCRFLISWWVLNPPRRRQLRFWGTLTPVLRSHARCVLAGWPRGILTFYSSSDAPAEVIYLWFLLTGRQKKKFSLPIFLITSAFFFFYFCKLF